MYEELRITREDNSGNYNVSEEQLFLIQLPPKTWLSKVYIGMPRSADKILVFCSINAEKTITTVENWKSEFQLS